MAGADDGNNMTLALLAFAVLIGTMGVLVFMVMRSASAEEAKPDEQDAGRGQPRRRGAADRMQRGAAAAADESDEGEEAEGDQRGGRRGNREQKKQERRAQQDADRQMRQDRESAKSDKQSKYLEKQRERDAVRQRQDEEEKKAKEVKEKKEQEDFDKWKKMFSVEAEGQDDADNAGEGESVVERFVEYIKVRKVVSLEDVAAEFSIRASAVIDRIRELEKLDRLSGVFDDRGKYVYISSDEMTDVAEWLRSRGRISRSELIAACNRLVRLEPSEGDRAKLDAQRRGAAEALEKSAQGEAAAAA